MQDRILNDSKDGAVLTVRLGPCQMEFVGGDVVLRDRFGESIVLHGLSDYERAFMHVWAQYLLDGLVSMTECVVQERWYPRHHWRNGVCQRCGAHVERAA